MARKPKRASAVAGILVNYQILFHIGGHFKPLMLTKQ